MDILNKELEHIESRIQEVRRKLMDHEDIPPPSRVLEEYIRFLEELRAEPEEGPETSLHIVVNMKSSQELDDDEVYCRRLYRRLAKLCHPDKKPDETMWFTDLTGHRDDRIWLEAMEGALDPICDVTQSKQEDSVSELFQRLFSLHEIQAALKDRIRDMEAGQGSYRDEESPLDEEIERG